MTSYQRLRLLLNSSLDANQKLVAIALSDHMSDTRGYALCGVARLALLTSLSERTVQRVLNQGDGDWLKRDMKPGAKQYPTYILWSKLPNKRATGDNASHVPDGHMCQPDACDGEAHVTGETATGDNLSADGCQTGHSQVTGCHPKPTIKPTREANQGSQPEPAPPDEEPAQPEADWDAIEAAILKARDAEIESYFTAPIQTPPAPEPTTRKPPPDFGALFGKLTTAPATPAPEQESPPAPTLPPDLDLLQMLTSRPDGAQGQPLAVAQRWHRALVTAGLTSPADLERYTLREIQMLPGMSAPSAGHVRDAVEAWGGTLAMGGRELVDSLRRRAFSGKLTTTPAEKRLMDAANIRPLDIRQMSDFDVHTFAQRLDQARSRL